MTPLPKALEEKRDELEAIATKDLFKNKEPYPELWGEGFNAGAQAMAQKLTEDYAPVVEALEESKTALIKSQYRECKNNIAVGIITDALASIKGDSDGI